jgi:LmbE family N-acetylglucosaminyl deacetylase
MKSILLCFAHPDDEVGVTPLAKRYLDEGAHVNLVCATNGDVGTVDEKYLIGFSSVSELRLTELACAVQSVGYTEVITLGYRDSGMMGSSDNSHPDSFWTAPLEEVTSRLVQVMRRTRPQIVITFNRFGAYGHPDHIKIHTATLAAFQLLESLSDGPRKLYYTSLPRRLLWVNIWLMRLTGRNPRKGGRNHDVDFMATYNAADRTTTRIPCGRYFAVLWQTLHCYASQVQLPRFAEYLGPTVGRLLVRTVPLTRAIPEPKPHERVERDLFSGIASR